MTSETREKAKTNTSDHDEEMLPPAYSNEIRKFGIRTKRYEATIIPRKSFIPPTITAKNAVTVGRSPAIGVTVS